MNIKPRMGPFLGSFIALTTLALLLLGIWKTIELVVKMF